MKTVLHGSTLAILLALSGLAPPAQADTRLVVLPGSVSASAHDGNVPANTVDGAANTIWRADTSSGAQWIQYGLGGCHNVTGVQLAWARGDARSYRYRVQTSVDAQAWTEAFRGASVGAAPQFTPVAEVAANYVRIASDGNDVERSVALSEAQIMTSGAARCPTLDAAPQSGIARSVQSRFPAMAAVASYPGENFDLGGYTLQLPTGPQGSVDTVGGSTLESGYTNQPYFYSDSDGAMVMMEPRVGSTTSGSQHPRTELRENATWTTGGTNILDANLAVTKIPGNTAIAQIFQGTGPSKPLGELQYSASGAVKLFLEDTNQGGASHTTTIATVPVGTRFTYQLKLSGKTITVKVNGTTRTFTMDDSFVGEKFYFKAGNYDQTATQGTPQAADGTVVKFYSLDITH